MDLSFKNITKFSNILDYIPILTAALIVDLSVIIMSISGFIESKSLKEWYHKYNLSAVIADVLSIVIGIIVARYIYSYLFSKYEYNILLFIVVAVLFQLFHDIIFYIFFNSVPRGKSAILDTFKDYANEMGAVILLADATMITSTILLSSILAKFDTNTNIIIYIVVVYITPYLLYTV